MIIICTHQSPDILEQCLKSIRKFSKEKHKVLCVETSSSQISKPIAEKYDCLFENSELKYEIGAFNHATNSHPDEEEYFMFQDSVEIVADGWEHILRIPSSGDKMVALCAYKLIDDPCPGCGEDVFYNLFNKSWPLHEAYGVLTNNFYVTKTAKNKLKEFGIDLLKAENKNDTYGTERVLGAIAHHSCGFDSASSVVGDWIWDATQFRHDTGFTKYIYKHTLMRQ
jgi:glycosyltransferase involved in cell wall biosynthesis